MELEIKKVENKEELEKVFRLREIVFVEEQGVPLSIEKDDADYTSLHLMAVMDDKTVGCGRIEYFDDYAKIGRLAVAKEYRKHGIGRKICQELMNIAKENGSRTALLHAQLDSRGFYEKLGFKSFGDEFIEAGIRHIEMKKNL
ncbi:MAG: GNAT family N-acetyltransferase [Halanaerobiaceae bacterium]